MVTQHRNETCLLFHLSVSVRTLAHLSLQYQMSRFSLWFDAEIWGSRTRINQKPVRIGRPALLRQQCIGAHCTVDQADFGLHRQPRSKKMDHPPINPLSRMSKVIAANSSIIVSRTCDRTTCGKGMQELVRGHPLMGAGRACGACGKYLREGPCLQQSLPILLPFQLPVLVPSC